MSEVTTLDEPVRRLAGEAAAQLQEGIAICLSGGGYGAMLFHSGDSPGHDRKTVEHYALEHAKSGARSRNLVQVFIAFFRARS